MIRICNHCLRRVLPDAANRCPSCSGLLDLEESQKLEEAEEARLALEKAQRICNLCKATVVPAEDGSCPACSGVIDPEESDRLTLRAKAAAAIEAEEREAELLSSRHKSRARRYLIKASIASTALGGALLLLSIFVFPEESKAHHVAEVFGILLLLPLAILLRFWTWVVISNPSK
jgi:RNA polymerase subunit RPABC4/transcription elongation factor Spt4